MDPPQAILLAREAPRKSRIDGLTQKSTEADSLEMGGPGESREHRLLPGKQETKEVKPASIQQAEAKRVPDIRKRNGTTTSSRMDMTITKQSTTASSSMLSALMQHMHLDIFVVQKL